MWRATKGPSPCKMPWFCPPKKADYRVIPWATFTQPELARVGLTEEQARKRYGDDLMILRHDFDHVDRALAEGAGIGFAKFVTRKKRRNLGGTHRRPSRRGTDPRSRLSHELQTESRCAQVHHPRLSHPGGNQQQNRLTTDQTNLRQQYSSARHFASLFRLSPSLGPLTRHCHRPESWRLWESEPLGGARRHPPCARATGTTVF